MTPPIVIDLVNGKILQGDEAQRVYEQMVTAQRNTVATAGPRRPRPAS
jgi:hypothetical protein